MTPRSRPPEPVRSPNSGLGPLRGLVVAQFGCATLGDERALHTVPEGHRFSSRLQAASARSAL